jgi:hypothetical protein
MVKKIAATVSATAFVLLAIALAPHVPTALATASHGTDANANGPAMAAQSCASFEVWFLDPDCGQLQRAKKIARTKQRLAHRQNR